MTKDYKNYLYGIKDFPLYVTNYIYPALYIKYKGKLYSVCDIEKYLAKYIEYNENEPERDIYLDTSDYEEFRDYIITHINKVKSIIIQMIKKKIIKEEIENVSILK